MHECFTIYFYVYGYLLACTSMHHMCVLPSEEGLDPLELEIQTLVSHHLGAKNQSQVLWKNIQ